jgi:HSP20 family protein
VASQLLHISIVVALARETGMARDLIRRMQSLFFPLLRYSGGWRPATDVYRTSTGWLVKFDLAGVRPEDVCLEAAGHVLTVSGERRDDTLDEGACHYLMEIAYAPFERSLELPCNLDRCRIATAFRAGLLHVTIEPECRDEQPR